MSLNEHRGKTTTTTTKTNPAPLTSASRETVVQSPEIKQPIGKNPSASSGQTSHVDGDAGEAPTLVMNVLTPTCTFRVHFQPAVTVTLRQTSPNQTGILSFWTTVSTRLVYIGETLHEQWPRFLFFLDWPWRWIEQAYTGETLVFICSSLPRFSSPSASLPLSFRFSPSPLSLIAVQLSYSCSIDSALINGLL